jgi:hypothetical protein
MYTVRVNFTIYMDIMPLQGQGSLIHMYDKEKIQSCMKVDGFLSFFKLNKLSQTMWRKSGRVWMRSSRLVTAASDCQCQSRNIPGFDPRILRHSAWNLRGILENFTLYLRIPGA